MNWTDQEERIRKDAIEFANKHKREIAKRLTDPSIYPPEANPVSVFMAGSPGAGKTEASIELLNALQKDGAKVLRIDPDELRQEFAEYTGNNSRLFQGAVSILVERIHDLALDQKQSFLLDGTLSHYEVARKNINRSLKRKRTVQILYVYQEPRLAWQIVQAREAVEGRNIPPVQFIDQYFAARDVVNRLKRELGAEIQVDLLMKNNDGSGRFYRAGVDQIDNHIAEKYDRAALEQMLGLG